MSISQNELRKYEGNGKLHFSTGENIDCKFEIQCHDDRRSNVTCCVPVSRDFIKILEKETDNKNHNISEASLTGKTSDRGNIIIEKLGLDKTTVNTSGGRLTKNVDGSLLIESSDPSIKGVFVLIPFSNIEISYSELHADDAITVCFAIFNFEFEGNERSRANFPHLDKFTLLLVDIKWSFNKIFTMIE